MPSLTASEITTLTTIIDGQPRGRLASTAKTVLRLHKALADAIGLPLADTVVNNAMACATYDEAAAIIIAAIKLAQGEAPTTCAIEAPELTPEQMDAYAAEQAAKAPARKAALKLVEAEAPTPVAAKPARKARAAKADKAPGKRASILEAAQRGEMPAAPDFSAETHKRFRAKLAEVVAAAEAGDLAALRAFQINPISSSPKAIAKYRDLAVIALEARAAKGAAA